MITERDHNDAKPWPRYATHCLCVLVLLICSSDRSHPTFLTTIYLDHGDNWVTGMNRNRTETSQCAPEITLLLPPSSQLRPAAGSLGPPSPLASYSSTLRRLARGLVTLRSTLSLLRITCMARYCSGRCQSVHAYTAGLRHRLPCNEPCLSSH